MGCQANALDCQDHPMTCQHYPSWLSELFFELSALYILVVGVIL